ncbi:hypothetical protein MIND_00672500 [Mycena indigotica]|uniref:F-box domain-containing protein n=1 Tax=Mycena indigotica TaxID=2126181 RepID=A0A8H6SJY5_9AGAR|nr:uncharacterized protein MIND_00672500 [Mycena indigotica]KAF7301085.1 hypothetical protein MIND_00672500 [Mycena indigotica]
MPSPSPGTLSSASIPIPLEIIQHILCFCDRQTLHAASLVAHHFLDASQRELFSELKLRRASAVELKRLSSVLVNSPHIASYVRVLSLSLDLDHFTEISLILQALTSLTAISLNWHGSNWETLDEREKVATITVLGRSTLTIVTVTSLRFKTASALVSMLCSLGPNVQSLSLIRVQQENETSPATSLSTAPKDHNSLAPLTSQFRPGISTLKLPNGIPHGFLLWLRNHADPSHIQTLVVPLWSQIDGSFQQLLRATVNLQHLTLSTNRLSVLWPTAGANLNNVSRLASLTFESRFDEIEEKEGGLPVYNPLVDLCSLLRRTHTLPQLTKLTVRMVYACTDPMWYFHQPGADLNSLLSEPVASHIKSVLIVYEWSLGSGAKPQDDIYNKDALRKDFAEFLQRGTLSFGEP